LGKKKKKVVPQNREISNCILQQQSTEIDGNANGSLSGGITDLLD